MGVSASETDAEKSQSVVKEAPPIIFGFQDPYEVGWPRQLREASTARRNRLSPEALGWLVFLKRNARFMPTNQEMATEYLRRYRKKKA